jgi:hypothetical protein
MRLNFILLSPLLALVPVACGTAGDSSSASYGSGAGGETTGTASTSTGSGSNATGSGGASTGSASTGSASTGSASTGSASTGSASTGSASTGSASTGSASTGSASTGSASTGSGGGGACSGYIDVVGPNGVPQHFATACDGAWGANETTTALGYHFSGGVFPGLNQFDFLGCASAAAKSPGVHFSAQNAAGPGTYSEGAVSYTDANGGAWSNTTDPYKVVITKLDMPGGVIEGSFSAMVIGPGDTKLPLKGTFQVCRVSDLNAP